MLSLNWQSKIYRNENLNMNLNRKFLIISTLVVGVLMQLLMWGDFVSNKYTPSLVLGLMFLESILVVLLIIYVIKNKKKM
jgi:hypothetical protein